VLEADGGEQLGQVIEQRFLPNLPNYCLGITLISNPASVIARDGLPEDKIKLMTYAAIPLFSGRAPLGLMP